MEGYQTPYTLAKKTTMTSMKYLQQQLFDYIDVLILENILPRSDVPLNTNLDSSNSNEGAVR